MTNSYDVRSGIDVLDSSWANMLKDVLDKYGRIENIQAQIDADLEKEFEVYPPCDMVFRAFSFFPLGDTRVVVVGQDPYHNPDEANGLCFSVKQGCKMPPSLRNIFKELQHEYGTEDLRQNTELEDWAKQGVLLVNRALTVRQACPNSHKRLWQDATADVIKMVSDQCDKVVFMLWGNDAKACKSFIDAEKHLVLEHTHPSPLARAAFVGNMHFKTCNEFLERNGKQPIQWL